MTSAALEPIDVLAGSARCDLDASMRSTVAWVDQGSVLASGPVSVPGLRLVLTCCHSGVKEGRQEPVQSLLIVGGEGGAQVGVESAGDVGGSLQ